MKNCKLFLALICLALMANMSVAQVPGDGVPDVYLVVPGGETFNTSAGMITRPVGSLVVDTDGTDMVALLIEGPDFLTGTPDNGDYLFGFSARLPDPNAPAPLFSSDWTTGYIAGKSQWVRTNPLNTDGFVGVIGEYEDPFGIFPNLGVGDFDGLIEDLGAITYATSESGTYATNPEPGQFPMGGVTPSFMQPGNEAPVAMDNMYDVLMVGGTLNVPAPGVLGNDSDPDNGPDPLTAVLDTDVSSGNLTLNSDGSFTYTHTGSGPGMDSFTYTAFDGLDSSNVATVSINIVPEPTALSLFGMAVLGLFGLRRRG